MFIDDRDIHFLSKHQANALLALTVNSPRRKVLLLLMLDAGLRVSETVNLKLSDFDFKKRILTVFSLKKRNKTKYRQIPLSNRLFFALSDYIKSMRNVHPDSWLFPSPFRRKKTYYTLRSKYVSEKKKNETEHNESASARLASYLCNRFNCRRYPHQ
jgi:integrase